MYFFLEGPKRIGKSTLIRQALAPFEAWVAGFCVQRLFKDGKICGYRAIALCNELMPVDGIYEPEMEGVFLYEGQYFPDVLEMQIDKAQRICEEESCHIILLDEIGGSELISSKFMSTLYSILDLGKPCVGVIKAIDSLANRSTDPKHFNALLGPRRELVATIEFHGKRHFVNTQNLEDTENRLRDFIAQHLCTKGNNVNLKT